MTEHDHALSMRSRVVGGDVLAVSHFDEGSLVEFAAEMTAQGEVAFAAASSVGLVVVLEVFDRDGVNEEWPRGEWVEINRAVPMDRSS